MLHRLLLGALVAALPFALHAKSTLTVYTALEADQIKVYKERFEKDHGDIELRIVRDSTGIITARLLAEKANPQADVVWGVAATSMTLFDQEGMLMPYAPKGLDKVSPQYRDRKNPPAWVGMDVWAAAICFNAAEAAKRNLPAPRTWKDLTKPIYKGMVVMPNPVSSGTGFFDVLAWLQIYGEKDGWQFMDGLHENVAQYTHSGSKPCRQAGAGEYPIGISFEYRASKVKASGAPVVLVFPEDGLGWDLEATGIMKATRNAEAAKRFADWAVSPGAMQLYADNFAILAVPGHAKPLPHIPANFEAMLVKNDFAWAAKNRARILDEWQKRYGGKSEPK